MISIKIKEAVYKAIQEFYPESNFNIEQISVHTTKPDFEGDYTVVLFPFVKQFKVKPDELGSKLGAFLIENNNNLFVQYQIISGFLNLTISQEYYMSLLQKEWNNNSWGIFPKNQKKVMIEYSSPNTNKPIHFGHLRNIFLGYAISNILKELGYEVIKANLINDRGIHICKSMVAWQHFANDKTPQSESIKGDHFVGDYYVKFNDAYKAQIKDLVAQGVDDKLAEKEAPLMQEAQAMLRKWEAGDKEIYNLWLTMNNWVYDGFKTTYKRLGVDFDKMYYESDTYLLGKDIVNKGLETGVLFKKEDGSVWIDLTDNGLDSKLLLRGDGTSVYMTQDIGTAILKYNDFNIDSSVYVIGDEQNHHMQVLKCILKKLEEPCADGIFHLSYGMVELPSGRMKSREGTVVDADDMMNEMEAIAKEQTEQAGKASDLSNEELLELYTTIGMGALKFYLLRVEPKKKMIFDPKESIDLHGYTATFVQYAHARICSILRRNNILLDTEIPYLNQDIKIDNQISGIEKNILVNLEQYPQILQMAGKEMNPSILCNYVFVLAQQFNSFFEQHSIIKEENEALKQFRLKLIIMIAHTLRKSMSLLGIKLPNKM